MKKIELMIMTKVAGILLIGISLWLFRMGIRFNDSGHGARLTNVRLIGGAILLFIGGITLCFTTKTLCEIFGVLC